MEEHLIHEGTYTTGCDKQHMTLKIGENDQLNKILLQLVFLYYS